MFNMQNSIILGENWEILTNIAELEPESVDLIYLDPPFNSNKDYICTGEKGTRQHDAQVTFFTDVWKSMPSFIDFLERRLIQMKKILKPTGSIYLHCDDSASHYIKVMMDRVFDIKNFQNEIVWHYRRWTNESRRFQRMHDIIFWYSKSNKYIFNKQYQDYANEAYIEDTVRGVIDGKLQRLKDKNGDYIKRNKEKKGVVMHDVWHDINFLAPTSKERVPGKKLTQKPLALLERIIKTSSNEGDTVMDPFMGTGTTLVASTKLGRNFIGIEMNSVTIGIAKTRLREIGVEPNYTVGKDKLKQLSAEEKEKYKGIRTLEDVRKLGHYDYQHFLVSYIGGTVGPKGPDGGRDGWVNNSLIQVKQNSVSPVGKPVAQQFLTVIQDEGKKCGIIIAQSFSKILKDYIEKPSVKERAEITLYTDQEILDGKYHSYSDELDFELTVDCDKDGNFISITNRTEGILNFQWWINKGHDPFFEGEDTGQKPCLRIDKTGKLIISEHKRMKKGENIITCMATNKNGEKKAKELNYYHT